MICEDLIVVEAIPPKLAPKVEDVATSRKSPLAGFLKNLCTYMHQATILAAYNGKIHQKLTVVLIDVTTIVNSKDQEKSNILNY